MSEIKLKKGESVDKALKKLKKKLLKEKTLEYARGKNYYEKPATKKYKSKRKAKYIQRLKSKEEREYWG
jgi:small subunit ribosomal protein S21|tara:strand:+ start:4422 stop:4628 length:207 start_codon:yes stop_codon:yes gene_type:complete